MTLDQMSASALDDTFLLDNTNIIGTYVMLDSQKLVVETQEFFHLIILFLITQFKYMALVQFLES